MVYSPHSSDDRGMSWLLSIANVHSKTPYKALNKKAWRNRSGIYHDFHRHGVRVYHGLDAILPTGKDKHNTKMVITVRDLTFKRYMSDYGFWEKLNRKSRIKKACKKAQRVIATSRYLKQQLVETWNVPEDKIDVIYTAFRNEYLTAKTDEVFLSNTRAKYHMPSRFVLAITDFSSLGNMETLFKAFAKLEDKSIDLVLLGYKNSYYSQMKKMARDLNIDDRVVRVASVNKHNFMALYALAKVFVDPSLCDGMGQDIIESMVIGTPAVASDSGCHREVGGDAVLYFDPADDNALAEHINNLLSDDNLRSRMIEAGSKQAAAFTQQALAQNTMLSYNKARGKA